MYYNLQQPAIHSDRLLVEYWLIELVRLRLLQNSTAATQYQAANKKDKGRKEEETDECYSTTVPYNTMYERNELRLKQQLCVKELGLEAKEVDVYITTTNTI